MSEWKTLLYMDHFVSETNGPDHTTHSFMTEGKWIYDLSERIISQINDIAGSAWTYQFPIPGKMIPERKVAYNSMDDGIFFYFRDPDHALLFKLASDLHLEVIS